MIVAHSFDDAQPLGPSLAEEYAITCRQIFRSLDKAECHHCTVACPDESTVDVNDGTCLRYRPNVKHGLVLGFDGGRMA